MRCRLISLACLAFVGRGGRISSALRRWEKDRRAEVDKQGQSSDRIPRPSNELASNLLHLLSVNQTNAFNTPAMGQRLSTPRTGFSATGGLHPVRQRRLVTMQKQKKQKKEKIMAEGPEVMKARKKINKVFKEDKASWDWDAIWDNVEILDVAPLPDAKLRKVVVGNWRLLATNVDETAKLVWASDVSEETWRHRLTFVTLRLLADSRLHTIEVVQTFGPFPNKLVAVNGTWSIKSGMAAGALDANTRKLAWEYTTVMTDDGNERPFPRDDPDYCEALITHASDDLLILKMRIPEAEVPCYFVFKRWPEFQEMKETIMDEQKVKQLAFETILSCFAVNVDDLKGGSM